MFVKLPYFENEPCISTSVNVNSHKIAVRHSYFDIESILGIPTLFPQLTLIPI